MIHEKRFERDDGRVITLTHIAYRSVFHGELEIDAFARVDWPDGSRSYVYPNKSPDKTLNGLTVAEYIERGRKGLVGVLRPHELIAARMDVMGVLNT